MTQRDARQDAEAFFRAAIQAVDPHQAVLRFLHDQDDWLSCLDRAGNKAGARIRVVGAGKASAPMAQAVEDLLGNRLADGMVVVKYDHGLALDRCEVRESGHPVPDDAGIANAAALGTYLDACDDDDLIIGCWSGGASALLPAPVEGVCLADQQALTQLLLGCGADIHEINTVRKHCSRIKGGHAAARAYPATMINLFISDVVGDDLAVIGSGPTVGDPTTFDDTWSILRRYHLVDRIPDALRRHFLAGRKGERGETPKPGDPRLSRASNHIIASNALALDAAAATATKAGYRVDRIDAPLTGEARTVPPRLLAAWTAASPPACLLAGGEPTVDLGDHPGHGGRSQEAALAAALAIEGRGDLVYLAGGTDGNDGPTDAAGGLVDGSSLARIRAAGRDPVADLNAHDAYPCLAAADDLLITGPTRTNVMDVHIILKP